MPDTEPYITAQVLVDKARTIAWSEGRLVKKDPIDGSFVRAEDYFAQSIARLVSLDLPGQPVYDFEDGWVADKLGGQGTR